MKETTILEPARETPVLSQADVVVVGGGTAGFVAAVAAARTGAHTVLIERNGFLGGSATGTYNTNLSSSHDSDGYQIMGGVGWEVMERLVEAGGAFQRFRKGANAPTQIFPETTKTVALEMVHEAGVELFLHTWAADVLVEDGVIKGVFVQSKSGRQAVLGKTFVDASADADIAFGAGALCDLTLLEERWTTSLDLTVCNIDAERFFQWARDNAEALGISSFPEDFDHTDGLRNLVTIPVTGPRESKLPDGSTFRESRSLAVKLMIRRSVCRVQGHVQIDGTDVRELTRAEYEGRREALESYHYLRENVPGFADAFVIEQSPLGVRETRRVIGDYVLTIGDILEQVRFADVVGLNCRAIDKHEKNDRFSIKFLQGHHDIPLRALVPQGIDNLLVAGRCISSDHESNASLRGGGTCMITGHAAGTTAALASLSNGHVRDLDIKTVQKTLLEQRAVLTTEQAAPVA